MSLHEDAVARLAAWAPYDGEQSRLRELFLDHLDTHPDALSRDCNPDHLTASAVVVSADRRRVLLNLHGKYQRWMQFGGHCEPSDASLADAALRETTEESGIDGLRLVGDIAQLSRHKVRCGPIRPSHHLDVRFVMVAPDHAAGTASDESLAVRWFDIPSARDSTAGSAADSAVRTPGDALPHDLEPEVRALVGRAALSRRPGG